MKGTYFQLYIITYNKNALLQGNLFFFFESCCAAATTKNWALKKEEIVNLKVFVVLSF